MASNIQMADLFANRPRVSVDGKFFRRGAQKLYLKGVAYGPFAPNAAGEPFATPENTARDFALAQELGANLLRIYHVPPRWFLDLAAQHDLLLLIDVPWDKHLCFIDSPKLKAAAREAVRRAVTACARHPAVFAYCVANEIPADVVRWSGAARVAEFIDELVLEAKRIDPDCLCTYSNFPPTEFLQPQTLDFISFNVYLHQPQAFKNYLARLQMLAESKPLVLGELGMDSLREGEEAKCQFLQWQLEFAYRGGLAGAVVFSFTDDWHTDGRQIKDWELGITTIDRKPKKSFHVVQKLFRAAPYFPLAETPKVSVVVASYNSARTLKPCLESLRKLNYPDYEVILVDDGSMDSTPQIASEFRWDGSNEEQIKAKEKAGESSSQLVTSSQDGKFRYVRHPKNLGLSVARNTGIETADGEIVAFTDADCRVDEDWLYYLIGALLKSGFAAMGGPNLLPPEDSAVAAAVMVSPGGPAHVMLDDRQAEHIPGCNMAFYKWALTEIGGFDPIFTKAGDDVDVCWRLQQTGCKIGFSPAAFVWHYRRSTLGAYLRQQFGYGEAEAMLVRKHPEYFNSFGDSIWRGRIYTPAKFGVFLGPPIIYRGVFGSAPFQTLYASEPAHTLMLLTTLEYHVLITLPLLVLSVTSRYLLPMAIASALLSIGVCALAGTQATLPKNKRRWWSRPLIAVLFYLQPIVRGAARYAGRLRLRPPQPGTKETLDSVTLRQGTEPLSEIRYWSSQRVDRVEFVKRLITELDRRAWPHRSDIGWSEFDVEIYGDRWCHLQLTTVSELHPPERQLMRCRLRARWSLQAQLVLCALLALETVAAGFFPAITWYVLVSGLAVTLLAFWYFVSTRKRHLQSLVTIFLDELAKEWDFVRVTRGQLTQSKPNAKPGPIRVEVPPKENQTPAGKDAVVT